MGMMLSEDYAPLPPPNAATLRALLAAVTLALAACGGGDCDDDCLKDHGPVDCKAQPEACT